MKLCRKNGKQVVELLLAFFVIISLTGCAEKTGGNSASNNASGVESTNDTSNWETVVSHGQVTSKNITPDLSEEESVTSEELEEESYSDPLAEAEATVDERKVDDSLTPPMRNSINMLNYMTSLTQHVNEEKGDQMFLESAYNSFDNLFPNSVDVKTQAQITSLIPN